MPRCSRLPRAVGFSKALLIAVLSTSVTFVHQISAFRFLMQRNITKAATSGQLQRNKIDHRKMEKSERQTEAEGMVKMTSRHEKIGVKKSNKRSRGTMSGTTSREMEIEQERLQKAAIAESHEEGSKLLETRQQFTSTTSSREIKQQSGGRALAEARRARTEEKKSMQEQSTSSGREENYSAASQHSESQLNKENSAKTQERKDVANTCFGHTEDSFGSTCEEREKIYEGSGCCKTTQHSITCCPFQYRLLEQHGCGNPCASCGCGGC
ncbi:unnamed protein product [Amoebophrya sp. A120]|nr:unnamed protein product [Amoebophrya sp. A120]|eukprot:GSA120T00017032001.1